MDAAGSGDGTAGAVPHARGGISDELFAQLERHFDHAQILELAITAGWYHTIAYVICTARVPLEPWAARFPAATA